MSCSIQTLPCRTRSLTFSLIYASFTGSASEAHPAPAQATFCSPPPLPRCLLQTCLPPALCSDLISHSPSPTRQTSALSQPSSTSLTQGGHLSWDVDCGQGPGCAYSSCVTSDELPNFSVHFGYLSVKWGDDLHTVAPIFGGERHLLFTAPIPRTGDVSGPFLVLQTHGLGLGAFVQWVPPLGTCPPRCCPYCPEGVSDLLRSRGW